ncbi:MAG TPA: hypothetical protein DCZ95_00510 [Verrucomicrobia bacterium]|nr:MAG: hypothetical protein A2X46_05850 [Lentisphaerae bacterium GWF2_57_35]HBA82551.1 hypothetical protein [Verrucomicrobiota bacterium]
MNKKTEVVLLVCVAAVLTLSGLFLIRPHQTVKRDASKISEERSESSMVPEPATSNPVNPLVRESTTAWTGSTPEQERLLREAEGAQFTISWDVSQGVPRSVRGTDLGARGVFSSGQGRAVGGHGDYEADAVAILDNVSGLFRMKDAAAEFRARRVDEDRLGFHHVRLDQFLHGVRVVGGELIVHFDRQDRAYEVNGTYMPDLTVGVVPILAADQAVAAARADLLREGRPEGDLPETPELVVLARQVPARLAYELTLTYGRGSVDPGRWRYWIDAENGAVLEKYNDIKYIPAPTASGQHVPVSGALLAGEGGGATNVAGWYDFVNTNYYLHNTNLHWIVENVAYSGYPDAATYAFRPTADWGVSDRTEISLALAFELTQRYFSEVHGLNSFNDLGILARANAHQGSSYVNAYWDGSEFYFGDGDGAQANSLAVLDIAGHEFTHAVTEYSANLVYQNEPGALNESFSDVLGSCIEFFGQADDRASYPSRHAGQADWLCGEDSWLDSTALRDLRNPANAATVGAGNEQPTRYRGTYWYSGSGDNGGVHQNSGVQNFFFYLLSEGGSGVNDGILYNVGGIGRTNAEQTAFRALTVYCTANTDYRSARSAWLSAAQDLDPAWTPFVRAAWDAVGVLAVSAVPAGGAAFSGQQGGPFSPASFVYTLTNYDSTAVGWGVSQTQAWASVAPVGGVLAARSSQAITVTLTMASAALPGGSHMDTLTFTNGASSSAESRTVSLMVLPPAVYTFDLNANPGWTVGGQWAFGIPQGLGGDPAAGFTGSNVYGYNLAGKYTDNMPEYFLTTPALDCSAFEHMALRFQRWLGVESAIYDRARVYISTNGVAWSTIWSHTGASFQDTSWQTMIYDLSAIADGAGTVYLRWGMGATDYSVTYSGWNLDDIQLLGCVRDAMRVEPGNGLAAAGYEGGPFSPTGTVYQVGNTGSNAFSWTASLTSTWASLSSSGALLDAGGTDTFRVALTPAAGSLTTGTYHSVLIVSNTLSGYRTTRDVELRVHAIPGEIGVSDSRGPSDDLSVPFGNVPVGLSRTESITATNADPAYPLVLTSIDLGGPFTLVNEPASFPYSIPAGSSIVFQVTYTPSALASNASAVVIESNDADEPVVQVALSGRGVEDDLSVLPQDGLTARGHPGGPFAPASIVYVLANTAETELQWAVANTQAWVAAGLSSGTLAAGETASVTVSLNAASALLGEGVHGDTVVFSNATSGMRQTRPASLTVFTSPIVQVAPVSLSVTNRLGQSQDRLLTIANAASADSLLTFRLTSCNRGAAPLPFAGQAFVSRIEPGQDFSKAAPDREFVSGELLVRFADGVTGAARTALLNSLGGGKILREYRLVPGLTRVSLPSGSKVEDALRSFNGKSGVAYAAPNYVVRALDTIPNDSRFGELWGLSNTGQLGGTVDADIDAPQAWDLQQGSTGVIVAVVDTGIDYLHEDLADNMWVNPGEIPGNGLDDDGNGYVDDVHGINAITGSGDPLDDHDHGTHCAGTIGGRGNNGVGVAGVCWRVRLMGAKFLSAAGSGTTADAITAIEYATLMGARVMNNSWGGGGYNQGLKDAIDAADAANIVFAAAAGNNNSDNDSYPQYPSSYSSSNIVAVMATDRNDLKSSFSSYGQTSVDIAAPGSAILSCQRGGGYVSFNGTSMATPHMAGAAALLLSVNPYLSAAEVKQALLSSVDALFPTRCVSGGRLNLARALDRVGLPWLTLNPSSATNLPPGSGADIQVRFDAGELAPAVYQGEVFVSCNDLTNPIVAAPVSMTVLHDELLVAPSGVYTAAGVIGGPFVPAQQVYVLSNAGPTSLTWTLSHTSAWWTVSAVSGSLAPAGAVSVTATIHEAANALPVGEYMDRFSFSNEASGVVFKRAALLRIVPPPPLVIHSFPLDADPGWATQGQWAFGAPLGWAGDPTSGFTGSNVHGYNLAGAYPDLIPAYALTTPALDCSGYADLSLSFRRWLGIESSIFDHASVQASSNGIDWVTVWEHSGDSFQDTSWKEVHIDLFAMSDDADSVYIRWLMGATDGSVTYSGWNIDDIQVLGQPLDSMLIRPGAGLDAAGYPGGPFSPSSQIYTVTNASKSNLTWTADCASNWVSVTPGSGTLAEGATAEVLVGINANAEAFGVGVYRATVVFSNGVSGAAFTRTANLTVEGSIAFDSASYSVDEDGGTALIAVRRSGLATQVVTVDFSSGDETATAGSDYVATNGTLTFAAGETTKTFAVRILDDDLCEGFETMSLILSHPTGEGTLGQPSTAVLTLQDDDGLFDDFDPDIDLPQWSSFGGTMGTSVIATNYGGFVSGPNSLWFGDNGDRWAVTRPLDARGGGSLSFWLRLGYGSSAFWETADLPNEGVVLEYSAQGGMDWVEMGRYTTTDYYSWTQINAVIPFAAQGSAMQFRWRQLSNSGLYCDHWALDDVTIDTLPTDALEATPADDLSVIGYEGDSFGSVSKAYTLTNESLSNLTWTAACASNWVSIAPNNGTLAGHAAVEAIVALNAHAEAFGPGVYHAAVVFSNGVSGATRTRGVNLTVAGNLAFDSASYAVGEAGGTVLVAVRRAGNTNQAVTVDFSTGNGTATAGSDYAATNGTLTFAAGETVKNFTVRILNDDSAEGLETATLTLSQPTGGGSLGNPSAALLTIFDDEGIGSSMPRSFYDGSNYLWDIQGNGRIYNGTSDAYDGGHVLLNFPSFTTGILVGARQLVVGPALSGSVRITRKIYVPADRAFCRFLEVLENIGASIATQHVRLDTDLGSDDSTIVDSTSSGDSIFDANDDWVVTDDGNGSGDPTMLHVIANPYGQQRASAASVLYLELIAYEYNVVLAPGETKIVMHFGAQNSNRTLARAQAAYLAALGPGALNMMSPAEIARLVNFGAAPDVSDADRDGAPDWWELQYGLNPSVSNAWAANSDDDDLTDLEEYWADTNPTNRQSLFPEVQLLDPPPDAILALVISQTSTARVYGVRWSTNLMMNAQTWTLCPPERTGTGSAIAFTITNQVPCSLYRTGVRLP